MSDEEVKKDVENTENKPLEATLGDSAESDNSEVVEVEFNEDGEEDLKKTLKKLREDLKQCRKEKEEYLTGWQRERAEFANYRKGEDDRKAMFSESIRERILTRFLTVADSFNMAFANREAWEKVDENWRKGVEYIYGQMNTIFEEYGIKEIGKASERFDTNIHQSMESVPTDKKELDHTVASVVQKGYKLGERVMRPARVNVYEYSESQS
ncbi:MAG TPA: nucleotide exchange factor GrpE [Candidatus Paceibacterota bacterium]|nr:nucleotide exchange factor GrpE [Candidatus Paceibacterota bacterium]